MKSLNKFFAVAASAMLISTAANAHFQLIYTPSSIVEKAGDLDLKLYFGHPMENSHSMDMDKPEEFFVIHRGKKTDLSNTLKEITFDGVKAYDGSVNIKRNGDYVLGIVPSPYYEESEDIYIQQLTKVFINKGDTPTDWSEPIGMRTEILPLQKPYGVVTGSTFTGVVLNNGKPAPGVEIEIEYMTARPDMAKNMPSSKDTLAHPGGAIALITDSNGQFTFGIPKAGYWGFAALGSGPDTEFEGKELSQDAVIWIEAHDLP